MNTLKETDILRPVVEHFRGMTGFDVYQEVYARLGDSTRRIDLIADDGLTLIACEGKAQLDDTVIEQARTLQGVSDFTYIVVPEPSRVTQAFLDRLFICEENDIGVIFSRRYSIKVKLEARRNANADVSKLRDACRSEHQDYAEAGSQREGYTPEKAWLQAFERALQDGPIPTSQVRRFVDARCPWRTTRLTISAIKDAIHEGKVAARLDGVQFVKD